jgi:serine/threonine protein kinase
VIGRRPEPVQLLPGRRLGRYELMRLVGRGSAGEVWTARLCGPRSFHKEVALKLCCGEGALEPFVEEARMGAMLSHPNLAATYELGQADGCWFIAMELVDGVTAARLAREHPLPVQAVIELGLQLTSALHYLHQGGPGRPALVHGDLTHHNVLVTRAGVVKLLDFGCARRAGRAGPERGTPGFMPLEQIEGRMEPRSDLFALGVLLSWAASHLWPFGRGIPALYRVLRGESALDLSGLEGGLADVLSPCLRSDPRERWPDAAALQQALRARATPGVSLAPLVERALA